jgi:hypothetical protein
MATGSPAVATILVSVCGALSRLVEQPEITARISANFDSAQSRWRMTFDMTLFIEKYKKWRS